MEDMQFPNPVPRTDLPVKKRRWPRVVGVLVVVVVLCIVFLPQILNTKVGRRLFRDYLQIKLHAQVSLDDFHTSWFGGTSASGLWIKAPDEHVIGCQRITTQMSLGGLLRGHFDLGAARVDGLLVDYVIDNGQGQNIFDMLFPQFTAKGVSGPPLRLSGDVEIHDGTVVLYRGQVDPQSLLVNYQTARVNGIVGQLSIHNLEMPWTFSLVGNVGDINAQNGSIKADGTVNLAAGGRWIANSIRADIKIEGADWPTVPVAPLLVRRWTSQDYLETFGPVLAHVTIPIRISQGTLAMTPLTIDSSISNIKAPLDFDFSTHAWRLGPGPNTLAMGLAKGFARNVLVRMNPFMAFANAGGKVKINLDSLLLPGPSAKNWKSLSAHGQISASDVKLEPPTGDAAKGDLLSQLQHVAGMASPAPTMSQGPARFDVQNGSVKIWPAALKIDRIALILSGSSNFEGALTMALKHLGSPALLTALPELSRLGTLEIPLIGTIDAPRLDLQFFRAHLPADTLKRLDAMVARNIADMRARELQQQEHAHDAQVHDVLRGFAPDAPPTTRP